MGMLVDVVTVVGRVGYLVDIQVKKPLSQQLLINTWQRPSPSHIITATGALLLIPGGMLDGIATPSSIMGTRAQ